MKTQTTIVPALKQFCSAPEVAASAHVLLEVPTISIGSTACADPMPLGGDFFEESQTAQCVAFVSGPVILPRPVFLAWHTDKTKRQGK